MGANLTVYCLEEVTDYFGFERLCHDLMSLEGYAHIEPLGGFSDKGRDAIHLSKSGSVTLFAYSVRESWRAKLAEDAAKIHKNGHACTELVFITTARFSPGERDEASAWIQNTYGWNLNLFGVERLRILLDVQHPQLKPQHPQIFPPDFLAIQTQGSYEAGQDCLFVSYVPEDAGLGQWLVRRLTAEGYLVWSDIDGPPGMENLTDNADEVIRNRAFRVIALYSSASLRNPETVRQRTLALSIAAERKSDFVVALEVDTVPSRDLDRVTRALRFISFRENWAAGLGQVIAGLEAAGCPKVLVGGRRLAIESLRGDDVIVEEPELVISNCLQILRLPEVVHLFEMGEVLAKERLEEVRFAWAYRRISDRLFLSFHSPPQTLCDAIEIRLIEDPKWRNAPSVRGVASENLVTELVRKSLVVKMQDAGLFYCSSQRLQYFPSGLVARDRLRYERPDGRRAATISVAGQRKYYVPSGSHDYLYYLAPVFSVAQDLFDEFVVIAGMRIRFADTTGVALSSSMVNSHRKRLTKDWWNDDWLNRILAVCQFLGEGGQIIIGEQSEEQIVIDAMPVCMNSPVGINESALDRLAYERSELAEAQDEGASDEVTDAEGGPID